MRISDWSSDVCSSDLHLRCLGTDVLGPRMAGHVQGDAPLQAAEAVGEALLLGDVDHVFGDVVGVLGQLLHGLVGRQDERPLELQHERAGRRQRDDLVRSEEHTSELQSLMRNSYAVFCLKKKKTKITQI